MTTTFTDAVGALAAEGREPTLDDVYEIIQLGIAEHDPANDPIIERLARALTQCLPPLISWEPRTHEYVRSAPGSWTPWGDATAEQIEAHVHWCDMTLGPYLRLLAGLDNSIQWAVSTACERFETQLQEECAAEREARRHQDHDTTTGLIAAPRSRG